MKLNSIYTEAEKQLFDGNIENSTFEAKELIKYFYKLSESDFLLRRNDELSHEPYDELKKAINRRLSGEPIQYILGEWDFMSHTFKVGDGVLIPRPETEILCQYVIDNIAHIDRPIVYDLCSGSGCIAISIKAAKTEAEVIAVEKSNIAYKYLTENNDKICGNDKVISINADIFDFDEFSHLPKADVIVSNPPYIRSADISSLQAEVQHEPVMALDGGTDGLIFYKHIISVWKNKLNPNGFFAFECGEEQDEDISDILKNNGFDSFVLKDYNNINRIVVGRRKC